MENLWSYRAFACKNGRCGCQRCVGSIPTPEPYKKKCPCSIQQDGLDKIMNLKDPLCTGTTEGFDVLVAQHRPPVYAAITGTCGGNRSSLDLLQSHDPNHRLSGGCGCLDYSHA